MGLLGKQAGEMVPPLTLYSIYLRESYKDIYETFLLPNEPNLCGSMALKITNKTPKFSTGLECTEGQRATRAHICSLHYIKDMLHYSRGFSNLKLQSSIPLCDALRIVLLGALCYVNQHSKVNHSSWK